MLGYNAKSIKTRIVALSYVSVTNVVLATTQIDGRRSNGSISPRILPIPSGVIRTSTNRGLTNGEKC